jgi:hypothetical protein
LKLTKKKINIEISEYNIARMTWFKVMRLRYCKATRKNLCLFISLWFKQINTQQDIFSVAFEP